MPSRRLMTKQTTPPPPPGEHGYDFIWNCMISLSAIYIGLQYAAWPNLHWPSICISKKEPPCTPILNEERCERAGPSRWAPRNCRNRVVHTLQNFLVYDQHSAGSDWLFSVLHACIQNELSCDLPAKHQDYPTRLTVSAGLSEFCHGCRAPSAWAQSRHSLPVGLWTLRSAS